MDATTDDRQPQHEAGRDAAGADRQAGFLAAAASGDADGVSARLREAPDLLRAADEDGASAL
ncbi:MAG TPA: hypothetical protein VLA19_12255, partial [Herpetosiphonaceae bacterium]|nr:hypothetical protein [Herpetosiphonaceae bacterium]